MLKPDTNNPIEQTIAATFSGLVRELHMVELIDYIGYIRLERLGTIADIVQSAAELHFTPGFIQMGNKAHTSADWHNPMTVSLQLLTNGSIMKGFVDVVLRPHHAEISLTYHQFHEPYASDPRRVELACGEIVRNAFRTTKTLPMPEPLIQIAR